MELEDVSSVHGPHARYVKLRVAHAPGMPGTFSPPPRVSDPEMHHDTTRHSRRMRNPEFYVSDKTPMGAYMRVYSEKISFMYALVTLDSS